MTTNVYIIRVRHFQNSYYNYYCLETGSNCFGENNPNSEDIENFVLYQTREIYTSFNHHMVTNLSNK